MYQRELKLQKGVKNKIQIQFKNSDQKLLNIAGKQFTFVLFDSVSQRSLIEKPVSIIDDGTTYSIRGLGEVIFSESDLLSAESTYYKFGVKELDDTGSFVPTYSNTYYGVSGLLEVRHDLYPTLVPSQEVTNFMPFYNADLNALRYEYYSGNIPAFPEYNGGSALQTAAIYTTNFKGTILIEGTLENTPIDFGHYAVISSKTYNNFSGIDYVNFTGVFSKVRFRYIPDKNPVTQQNNDTAYSGTVDKVLYRC